MFERGQAGEVTAAKSRRREHVAVEIQLEAVGGDAVRDNGQTAPRAVDDATGRVTEAGRRTRRRRRRRVTGRRLRRPRGQSADERLSNGLNP